MFVNLKAAGSLLSTPTDMQQQMHTGGADSDGEIASSESSLFLGGRLPAAWFADDTDDGSLSSSGTGGKTSNDNAFKSTSGAHWASPTVSKHELENSHEVDPASSIPFAPRYHLGGDYEVQCSAGFVLHQIGQCIPCLYHTRMGDGCRRGDACDHCHLCTESEARTRRNRLHLEAQKRARVKRRAGARTLAAREFEGYDGYPLAP
ncbi:unnamed protein product [Symbiodinium sp. CCMP2592]|nr:unnamed protein product [Symbiodinium sp. CCMP2592]